MKWAHRFKFNWMAFAALILVGAFLFTVFSKKSSNVRMAYKDGDWINSEIGGELEEEKPDTYAYINPIYGFSLELPVTWRQYSDDSVLYLVDQESSASIKITGTDYYPSINNRTLESVSEELVEAGYTFLNFSRISENHMELIYQDKGNKTFDYMDEIFWSRSDTLTLSCVFEDHDLDAAIEDLKLIVNSFTWQDENAIPEGYCLYYSDLGAFEVGIPSSWGVGTGDGYIVASDTVNGSNYTVRAIESKDGLNDLTALDVTNQLNQGQPNFLLQSFTTSEEEAHASARYLYGDQWILIHMELIANGQYQYSLVLQYPEGTITESDKDTIFSLFREFL